MLQALRDRFFFFPGIKADIVLNQSAFEHPQ